MAVDTPNPAKVPEGFEIRKLEREHAPWVAAIVAHSNIWCSPIHAVTHPDNKAARSYLTKKGAEYIIYKAIETGLSFGMFDLNYKFRRPESAATGGKLYWDEANTDATSEELLEQMDFPLASVALAYDGVDPFDLTKLGDLVAALPAILFGLGTMDRLDPRDKELRKPKVRGEVLFRCGTSTRRDYEGNGLAKSLAHHEMYHVATLGWKAIEIQTANDGVYHIWTNPPPPFKAELILKVSTADLEGEVDGKMVKPYPHCHKEWATIYVTL
jgi:hypothetical protein